MTSPFRTIYILGSSGFARELSKYIIEIFHVDSKTIMFVDDSADDAISGEEYQRLASSDPSAVTFIGSGNTNVKGRMEKQLVGRTATLIHPKAVVSKFARIDEGSVVAPGAVVSPGATIGKHCLINYNATIGHDCSIGDLSVISPNAAVSGWVKTGKQIYVGAGAQVRERQEIGDRVVIAMGASVVCDIPADHIAIGVPARIRTIEEWNREKEKRNGRHGQQTPRD